ncbi:MAG: hypothetical protein ACI8XU_000956 [Kiritimatiellia bacterium]|jgi:hypothetical protein
MNLKTVYLILAILGAVIPIAFFANFAAENGLDLFAFVAALFVNGAAGGFTADLLISSFVFWVYMFSNQGDGPKPWAFIALNLCIGLSCALPAYLWARTRGVS